MFRIDPDASPSDTLDSQNYIFDHSNDLLSIPLVDRGAESQFALKGEDIDNAPFAGFDNLVLYGQYDESGPSSVQFGDLHDVSERGGSHMSSSKENGDGHPSLTNERHQSADLDNGFDFRLSRGEQDTNSFKEPGSIVSRGPNGYTHAQPNGYPIQHHERGKSAKELAAQVELQDPRRSSAVREKLAKSNPRSGRLKRDSSSSYKLVADEGSQNATTPSPNAYNPKSQAQAKPRSSIPASMRPCEFARQCILAAYSSRLNPYALHPGEHELLKAHITRAQVTVYLNIRNAILRLWTRNPLLCVSREDALGCTKESRFFNLAEVAYRWLQRNGYINFGCLETAKNARPYNRSKAKSGRRRTVVVIGAGVAGLSCARQLEGLCAQLGNAWEESGERPPKVFVLEARKRIGGRVYSHPLQGASSDALVDGFRSTAEMGAQIVTGFDHGNPLNVIIRGQLGLRYHGLRDNSVLYDCDGAVVDKDRDVLVEKLYNDVLERASVYRTKASPMRTAEGDKKLIESGRDPSNDDGVMVVQLEDDEAYASLKEPVTGTAEAHSGDALPPMHEKLVSRTYGHTNSSARMPAAKAAEMMGWQLREGVSLQDSIDLNNIAHAPNEPTLGGVMDDAIHQYQRLLELAPQDMRLLNWHHANLEYANAASVNQLSLTGWDQDIGNEFEGEHSEIIGGYLQFPRGLWKCPTPLDIRFNSAVTAVEDDKSSDNEANMLVTCATGESFQCDQLVLTTPLGVLKENAIQFKPPLPDWKSSCIERLGFGLLNKVVLVYEKPFWEKDRDMFGLLNDAEIPGSLKQFHYESQRGRFYLFWNCIKTSRRPVLVALMAGNAANHTEGGNFDSIVKDVTLKLARIFAPTPVPKPSEAIMTQWRKDPFARGSYSYVGPRTEPGDYEVMAQPVGQIHFAGEATCGTHPATVHGAYLSGLRAASDVVNRMLGPIVIPQPLVPPRPKSETGSFQGGKRKFEESDASQIPDNRRARNDEHDAAILNAIVADIGERPAKPDKTNANPYLLFQKEHWSSCKARCDEERREATGDPEVKATRNEIRGALGQMWRNASLDLKQPYLDRVQSTKEMTAAAMNDFKEKLATWDHKAAMIKREYVEGTRSLPDHGSGPSTEVAGESPIGRRTQRIVDYAE